MIQDSIFKSYDIRGIYPSELNEDAAYATGQAFLQHTQAKNIVIGYDARLSSPNLFKALTSGLISQGAQVTTIGQMPTECLYFAVANYDFDAGIMITASHNPKEYNGLKMLTKKGDDITVIRGKDLLPLINKETTYDGSETKVPQKDILTDYKNYIFSTVHPENIKSFNIAIDASNGVIGKIIDAIKGDLPITITPINFTPDGNFPNHSPNPLESESVHQIAKIITENHLDFGIMFDGDADRIFLVDEKGNLVKGDTAITVLAKHMLAKYPGSAIVYNAICSKAVPEFITKWGGKPIRTPVGFVNVREGLIKNNGAMGGEVSAHYSFKDYFYMDCGIMAFLIFLQSISQDTRPVSEIVQEYNPYHKDESNFTVTNKDAILKTIQEKYHDGAQDFLDGVTVTYQDWWFNARPSNTEPLLRLTIEANTQDILEAKKQELTQRINS